MTLRGAIQQLRELHGNDDIPIYVKPAISKVIETLEMDTQEVRHGRWIMTDAYPHKVYCSECYATLIPNVEWFKTYNIASNYCPNCGSRMDLDEVGE